MTLRSFLCAFLLWIAPTPCFAEVASLIVSRNAQVTSFYLKVPAEPFLGAVTEAGWRNQAALAAPITFTDGHAVAGTGTEFLASHAQLITTDGSLPLKSLPTLLHGGDDPLRFSTPLEGSIATAVCATPLDVLPGLDALTLYTGWFADVPLEEGLVGWQFPGTAFSDLKFQVSVFQRGVELQSFSAVVDSEGFLALAPDHGVLKQDDEGIFAGHRILTVGLLFLALLGFGFAFWSRIIHGKSHVGGLR